MQLPAVYRESVNTPSPSSPPATVHMEGCCEGCTAPPPVAVFVTMVVAISVLGVGLILVADTVEALKKISLFTRARFASVTRFILGQRVL